MRPPLHGAGLRGRAVPHHLGDDPDCGGCRADYCQAEVAPFGCWCDAACEGRGDCCWDAEVCNN